MREGFADIGGAVFCAGYGGHGPPMVEDPDAFIRELERWGQLARRSTILPA